MSDLNYFKNRSIGMMSAERGHLSPEENAIRTAHLHKDLKKSGLNHEPVKGGYIENFGKPNAHEVTENSFLVSHKHEGDDKGLVHSILMHLGNKYDQDSILHKPHNSSVATFHGTNDSGWPGRGKTATAGVARERKGEPFFTRLSSGKEITFAENITIKNFLKGE